MNSGIRDVYFIHHSHTDIGYTDLQEKIIVNQADYIHTVLKMMDQPENQGFRWNCETLYCVEQFFKEATEMEKQRFYELVAQKKLGISANYLNFTDLLDCKIYADRLKQWQKIIPMKTAMFADINGVSMGYRDAMLDTGVEFLYTNIHVYHGMYPLYQNQNAFFWENAKGQRMLVWNGEHYNLGNAFGIKNSALKEAPYVKLGETDIPEALAKYVHDAIRKYLDEVEEAGYPYDFIISSVSGILTDNAPPDSSIVHLIDKINLMYGDEIRLHMVSLQELYDAIRPKLQDAPVYRGDMTDWWSYGVGSTPYAVKHYRDAVHTYNLCKQLEPKTDALYPTLARDAQDNIMLYAEHTWGYSASITNPYDTMVQNLDMRKTSYASKAHEAASRIYQLIARNKGDISRYYNANGKIRVFNSSGYEGLQPISFYVEYGGMENCEVRCSDGSTIPCQVSAHPRGKRITFFDAFGSQKDKVYEYVQLPAIVKGRNSRHCYIGAEGTCDIINDYDPETYKFPFGFENDFFSLKYKIHEGITSFVDKRTGRELLGKGIAPIFTPIYQHTPLRVTNSVCPADEERDRLGRNIRGMYAETDCGRLEEVQVMERGPIFTRLRLIYSLKGTVHADVILKFYARVPRIDFTLELGKTLSEEIESVFLPLSLNFENSSLYLRKGSEAFRPGVDQLPGSCMEYYMSEHGLSYVSPEGGASIAFQDAPMVYVGSMDYHPIRLCENKPEDNERPIYSWIMNNNWNTNFKLDLSGYGEFNYTLWLTDETDGEKAMDELKNLTFEPSVFITE